MTPVDYPHSPTPEEIMEYADGEGTAAARTAIAAHLATCRSCQGLVETQRDLSEDTRAWDVGPAPVSLRAPKSPARTIARRLPAWTPLRASLFAAAALAAALILTPGLQRSRTPTRELEIAAPSVTAPEALDRVQPWEARASRARDMEGVTLGGPAVGGPPLPEGGQASAEGPVRKTAVIRTATLRIVVKAFDNVRQSVEGMVTDAGGFIDQLTVTGDAGSPRALNGVLRVPSDRLTEMSDRLRQLGQVVEDSQGAQEVSDQLFDIEARLASARATERRLTELLRERTGKLSDVLEVERELARVRVDIERLDAESTNIARRVSYSRVNLSVTEERKAGLDPGPLSFASRIRVAAADGLEWALESVAGTLLFVLRAGPLLALWGAVFGSGWLVFRRIRAARGHNPQ
jgi:hypothetical protein